MMIGMIGTMCMRMKDKLGPVRSTLSSFHVGSCCKRPQATPRRASKPGIHTTRLPKLNNQGS